MRTFKLLLLLLVVNMASSQNYFGFLSDNYSGLQSVTLNPANVTSSKFRSEINLVSVNGTVNNDYVTTGFSDLFDDFDDLGDQNLNPMDDNNFAISADVLGPSFMFNLSPKHSIGLMSRGRTFVNINEIKGELFDAFEDDFDSSNDFSLSEDEFTSTLHGWAEVGLVYGRTLIDKEQHFIKGGVTLKYLIGAGNAYVRGSDLTVDFDEDGFGANNGAITTTGIIQYGSSQGINQDGEDTDFKIDTGSTGFGADIGFIYEYRPETVDLDNASAANYKLKLGLSITDIGSINYKNAEAYSYDITDTVDEDTFQSQEDFEDKLNNLYMRISTDDVTKVKLPTALHITADYNLDTQFFINLRTDLSLRKSTEINTNKIDNAVVVTPRFERKWVSVFLPLSVMDYSGFNAGFGFRVGPLFVGSSTIISNLISSKSKAVNAFLGLKIPIYKNGKSYANNDTSDSN